MAKVSIVLPTYNRGYCLADTIQSVIDQTYSDWELLIIDNYSEDNTRAIIRQFGDVRIRFYQVSNEGVIAKSRNLGIQRAAGAYIAFIDSDDPWLPRKLELSVSLLLEGYDVVYHDLYVTDGIRRDKKQLTRVSRPLKTPVLEDLVRNGNGINTSSVVTKVELLRRVSGFSESPELIGIEDYDLWVRLAMVTNGFGFIRTPLGYYTVDGNGTLNAGLVERCLKNISSHHALIHNEFCGGTPGWILIALASLNLRKDPAFSVKGGLSALRKEYRIRSRAKAMAVVVMALLLIVLRFFARLVTRASS